MLLSKIPPGLTLLITHSPPYGILDLSEQYHGNPRDVPFPIGDKILLEHLRMMEPAERPKVHVFGHEHDPGGQVLWDEELGMWFANCSAVDKTTHSKCPNGYELRPGFAAVVIDVDVAEGGIVVRPGN